MFTLPFGRGRGVPRPYGVENFLFAMPANFPLISHLR